MTVHRFFVEPSAVRGDAFALPAAIAHQVGRVLRLQDGDALVLLDGEGTAIRCRLADGGRRVDVVAREPATGEPGHRLTIVQALLKGDGLERVVRQGTELGVSAFRLTVTRRCVTRELSPRRLERLRAIARESAEQSERGRVPWVGDPEPIEAALQPGAVLLYERADAGTPRLGTLEPPASVVVGPEGGFDPHELATAVAAGARLASLGPRILRAESVAIAAAAIVLSRAGDFA